MGQTPSEDAVFRVAFGIESEQLRAEYLQQIGAADPDLRNRVELLLEASAEEPAFLEPPNEIACATLEIESQAHQPGTQIGPYKLREQIGEGGMGVVYVAEQTEPVKRKVALKIIKPGMASKDVVARFEAERQALAMMDHPNIAKVHDGGATESGQPYFVMELVQGLPITEYCDEHQLTTEDRLRLFATVCRAVQHAHQKGVIHRDLKPSNILVPEIDGTAVPKVIDFGVAKAIDQKLTERTVYTQFSQLVGTPLYMSPEQVGLGVVDIDTRSDVYALGVMLYELLTGNTPFDSETLKAAGFDEMRRIIREDEPPKPSAMVSTLKADALSTISQHRRSDPRKLSDSLAGELDWIVMKTLEKDRTRRYESTSALAEDVDRYLCDEPVLARPPSTFYRLRKFTRRNRALAASLAAIFVALSLGLTLAVAGFLTAQKRLTEVTEEKENNEILIKLLGDVYDFPWGKHRVGQQQTMHESLEKSAGRLEQRLHERPQLEIRVRQIVAYAYHQLGQHATACEHLQRALYVAEGEYGDVHETVADILTELADEIELQREKNSLAEDLTIAPFDQVKAQAYAERAISIYNQLDIESLGKGHALFCLAWYVEPDLDRHVEAERYLRQALQIARDLAPGGDSFRRPYAMWDLVEHLTWQKAGGSEEAMGLVQEAVAMSRRVNGEESPITAGLIAELGECLRFQGDEEGALASYREAWDIFRNISPANDPLRHSIGMTLAEIYCVADRHDQAIKVLAEIEGACRHRVMDSYVRCVFLRGWAHLLREDYAAAKESLQYAVDLAEKHLAENHAYSLLSRFHLARSLEALGRNEEATLQYRTLLPLTRERVRLPHARQMELFAHAWALLHSGEMDEKTLREALEHAEQGLARAAVWPQYGSGPHLFLAKAIAQYELDKLAGQDIDAAIATLREGLESHDFTPLRARHKHVPTSRHELESRLAAYLVEQGNAAEAEQVYREGIDERLKHFAASTPRVALAELRFGTFLLEHGLFARAEAELLSAYEKLITNSRAADANRERAAAKLIDLYTATDRPEKVAEWQSKIEEAKPSSKVKGR